MIFRKYEFDTKEKWEEVRETLYKDEQLIDEIAAIHEIGYICFDYDEEGECTDLSTHYAVDILLNEDLLRLNEFEVFPNPDGVHIFAGCSELYLKTFCDVNPESPYCKDEGIF
jgi:hypothetical protein